MNKFSLILLVVVCELFPHPTLKVWDIRNEIRHYLALPPLDIYLDVLPPLAMYLVVLPPAFIILAFAVSTVPDRCLGFQVVFTGCDEGHPNPHGGAMWLSLIHISEPTRPY